MKIKLMIVPLFLLFLFMEQPPLKVKAGEVISCDPIHNEHLVLKPQHNALDTLCKLDSTRCALAAHLNYIKLRNTIKLAILRKQQTKLVWPTLTKPLKGL